jgi:hypothetical protein
MDEERRRIIEDRNARVERCRRIYHRAAALRVPPDMTPEYMEPRAAPSVLAFIEALLAKLEDQG